MGALRGRHACEQDGEDLPRTHWPAGSSPDASIESARPFVRTPTYALLRQFRYGDRLRLQHWVRP